jgi:hypothetical protein
MTPPLWKRKGFLMPAGYPYDPPKRNLRHSIKLEEVWSEHDARENPRAFLKLAGKEAEDKRALARNCLPLPCLFDNMGALNPVSRPIQIPGRIPATGRSRFAIAERDLANLPSLFSSRFADSLSLQ